MSPWHENVHSRSWKKDSLVTRGTTVWPTEAEEVSFDTSPRRAFPNELLASDSLRDASICNVSSASGMIGSHPRPAPGPYTNIMHLGNTWRAMSASCKGSSPSRTMHVKSKASGFQVANARLPSSVRVVRIADRNAQSARGVHVAYDFFFWPVRPLNELHRGSSA